MVAMTIRSKNAHMIGRMKAGVIIVTKVWRGNASAYCDAITGKICSEWREKMLGIKDSYGPFRPERLGERTIDGEFTRSKSEMSIYNYLMQKGVGLAVSLHRRSRRLPIGQRHSSYGCTAGRSDRPAFSDRSLNQILGFQSAQINI